MHLIFPTGFFLTREPSESILQADEELLPDDVLSLCMQRCVLYGAHLWPEEFPDLA
jgi:hypothetical protein